MPAEVAEFVTRVGVTPPARLVASALKSLKRTKTQSDPRDLWDDSKYADEWRQADAEFSKNERAPNMTTHTICLHRVLKAKPEKVHRAFLDADALAKWLPPHGFTAKVGHVDAREGGTFRMSFANFTTGASHSFGGEYLELVPHERIRYTDRFDDPNLPGVMHVTVVLKQVSCGTDLSVTQEGVPSVIPAESCYLGWQESLRQLADLVEPEIPG